MAEIERTRERERGTIPETPYEIFIRSRKEFLERQETGQVVVKPSDREFFITRQGRLMYHLNPEIHKNTPLDRKSTRLNSSHQIISYAVFCLKKKTAPKMP